MNQRDPRESPIESQMAAPPPVTHQSDARPVIELSSGQADVLQSRGAVLAILFLVTGALGIPLLWINRNFSATERIVWTIIVTLYTIALLVFLAWFLWWWVYNPLFG